MTDGKVLPFVRPAVVVSTRRTPVSSWVSDSGATECTFVIETRTSAPAEDRAELVKFMRGLADLFESDAGRALFEED